MSATTAAAAALVWGHWTLHSRSLCVAVPVVILASYHFVRVRIRVPPAAHIPLTRALLPFVGIPIALVFVMGLELTGFLPYTDLADVAWMAGVAGGGVLASLATEPLLHRHDAPVRLAVVGSAATAADLAVELRGASVGYVVVGCIEPGDGRSVVRPGMPRLGCTDHLAGVVGLNDIDMLLIAPEASRMRVFEEISETCLTLPVRVMELSLFYEEVFGHVALSLINAAWFQYVMHPSYSTDIPRTKRAFDVAVALAAGIVLALPVAVAALLIRRDGGPAVYRQRRVGEKGVEFEILKLRTMRLQPPSEQRWSVADDERVTRIGRFLRRTHLDEIPQIFNVLRGDMTIVGPRPEQPDCVDRLEHSIPFYTRRHLVRPGITGWAQVQCGYCGSQAGSAFKLAHDLYYLKRKSLALDLLILTETVRALIADDQWSSHPECHTLAVPASSAGDRT